MAARRRRRYRRPLHYSIIHLHRHRQHGRFMSTMMADYCFSEREQIYLFSFNSERAS